MPAYYNEHDKNAAAWLRELIAQGHIASGEVDERSIAEVQPDDLRGFTQCHFFAGIGVWSYALRCAGWTDGTPVWTGSCPCQPFSASGKRGGTDDSRHLWPAWFGLIRECRPNVVFGEQVASGAGLAWLDFVCADMEGEDYAIGAADLCAAGVGAPHIRQRLYFVADNDDARRHRLGASRLYERRARAGGGESAERDPNGSRRNDAARRGASSSIAGLERREFGRTRHDDGNGSQAYGPTREPSATSGFWRDAEWIPCRDGKARAIEPGTFPLAYRSPSRVGRLRGYGNAIVGPLAQAFIEAYISLGR